MANSGIFRDTLMVLCLVWRVIPGFVELLRVAGDFSTGRFGWLCGKIKCLPEAI
ncbi:hypothetical protein HMPREF0578_0010 [Mobiluncus mulieris 28-1]|nr:hypothetical protein HMPREF0578_0010 [Mobiluncus mulieris 28-1]